MRTTVFLALTGALLAAGCAGPGQSREGPGAPHRGAPEPPEGQGPVEPAAGRSDTGQETIRLPERITLPAAYRLMLVDGHLTLVRETDPQSLQAAPASMRIVTGEMARGELAYQPGLLPQELAAEVAANRESAARMDNSLEAVMRRSRELSQQALELKALCSRLSERLSVAQDRLAELGAANASSSLGAAPQKGP